jgi:hypothetical protein
LWSELTLFLRTAAAFLTRPSRAARAWQNSERQFMNPLAFGASAAGLYWAVSNALALLWPVPGPATPETLSTELASALGPYLHYGLLGAAMHLVLRVLGGRRQLLGSVGVAFFIGGSFGTLTALLLTSVARWFAHVRGTSALELRADDPVPLALFIGATLAYALVCLAMARALQSLHYTPGWKAILACAFAVLFTALLFGNVLPDGSYGWHPYIGIERDDGIGFGFGFSS